MKKKPKKTQKKRRRKNPYRIATKQSDFRPELFVYDKFYIWNFSPYFDADFYTLVKFVYYDDRGIAWFDFGNGKVYPILKIKRRDFYGPFSSKKEAEKVFYKNMRGHLRNLADLHRQNEKLMPKIIIEGILKEKRFGEEREKLSKEFLI